jgi:hypothetical protein
MFKRSMTMTAVVFLLAAFAAGGAVRALNSATQPLPPAEPSRSGQVGSSAPNTLTDEERKAGWHLLFDGKTLNGWHNFKKPDVRPGWQVQNGVLLCADPHDAGDIVTIGKYDWFELSIDYNISRAGNSGIMFHVTDEGTTVWQTGPEIQLLDNKEGADPNKAAWLYQIYTTDTDATKPAGEWNNLRILISPEKCEHIMNGVKYFEYVMGSEDFNARVAKSKFGKLPFFAKSNSGYISLQGDHGQVSFRNIKIRPITPVKKAQ